MKIRNIFFVSVFGLYIASEAVAGPLYFNDFQTLDTSGWNTTKTGTDGNGESYLGLFGAFHPADKPDPWNGENITLTLNSVASGNYNITFDLFTINTWDGDGSSCCGPDTIEFQINGTSFFSGWFSSDGSNSAGLIASGSDTLAFTDKYGPVGNVMYSPGFDFFHAGGDLLLTVIGTPSQPEQINGDSDFYDEPWALDNVSISNVTAPVPEPSILALMGLGLAGIGFVRKKKLN